MAKKVLSIVLAIAMLMGVCAIGSFAAGTDWKKEVEKCFLGEIVYYGTSKSISDAELDQLVAQDPDIIERNLYFWDDYVIDKYNDLCADGTDGDWEDFYYEIAEDNWLNDDYEYYWSTFFKPEKAIVELTYEADKENVECGDEITVTVSAKTNFYTHSSTFAIFFDRTQVELKGTGDSRALYAAGESGIPALDCCWQNVAKNYDFGVKTDGSILYTRSQITGKQVDQRDEIWPAEWRGVPANYAQYCILQATYASDRTAIDNPNYRVSRMFDGETVMKATFVVKEGLDDGTEINFFALPGGARTLEDDIAFVDLTGNYNLRSLEQQRAIGPFSDRVPYGADISNQTYIFNNATVTVGAAAPEYADYTALDAAIDEYDDTNAADYTAATWAAYADAVAAGEDLARDILKENQATVDGATAAITNAKAALAKNCVVSATAGTATIGSSATVSVVVTGSPELVILTGAGTQTFERADATITDNGDGTETWKIKVLATEESADYTVKAKYANLTESGVNFTLKATQLDLSIHSIEIPDGYPNGANGDTVYKGKHTVIIKTSTDVTKIQFVDDMDKIADGATCTYAVAGGGKACQVSDDETTGERTWTVTYNFIEYGTWYKTIRTRSAKTLFATTGDMFTARVIY